MYGESSWSLLLSHSWNEQQITTGSKFSSLEQTLKFESYLAVLLNGATLFIMSRELVLIFEPMDKILKVRIVELYHSFLILRACCAIPEEKRLLEVNFRKVKGKLWMSRNSAVNVFTLRHMRTTLNTTQHSSLRKQPTFREAATWALAKRRLSDERRNSTLMTCTTLVLVVLLTGWKKIPLRHNQSETLPRSG